MKKNTFAALGVIAIMLVAAIAMVVPAFAVAPFTGYLPPRGNTNMVIYSASALGFAAATTSAGGTGVSTGSLINGSGIQALTVTASASSGSTLVLTGFLDSAGKHQAWQQTTTLVAGVEKPLSCPSRFQPFQYFRADILSIAGGTFSAQVTAGLGQN